MTNHTGSQVSIDVQPLDGSAWFTVTGIVTVDADGTMCLSLPSGALQPVPCPGFCFAGPVVRLAAAATSRSPSPDPRCGEDSMVAVLAKRADVAEVEARRQRELLLELQQEAAAEAVRSRAGILAQQATAAEVGSRERGALLAAHEAGSRERGSLLAAVETGSRERGVLLAAHEAASRERESLFAQHEQAALVASRERAEFRAESRQAVQEAADERQEIRAVLRALTGAVESLRSSQASPSPRQPMANQHTGSPLLFSDSPEAHSFPPPLGARPGTRAAPFELSPSPVAQATVDELLLGRERTTWSSHAVPPQELLFGERERGILRALPEYAFLKDDLSSGTWKRALRCLVERVAGVELGLHTFVQELATALSIQGRWLSQQQVAELHTLVALAEAGLGSPHLTAAIAEFALLGNPLFPVGVFDQVRLARVTRPQAKQEVAAWWTGELVPDMGHGGRTSMRSQKTERP
jgi:hypothetical protein